MILKVYCLCLSFSVVLSDNNDIYGTNVGTVLFKAADFNRQAWTCDALSLLVARKYFQKLIPPTDVMPTVNDDYAKSLLTYFIDAYKNLNTGSKNVDDNKILTIALSDTIGGYLKNWVLPAMRYGFYSGTVNYEEANNLFLFYEEIKMYLKTDGEGWRTPNEDIFIQISAPSHHKQVGRTINNACTQLAFFENIDEVYRVPLPILYWDGKSATLFLPLKMNPIVIVTSRKSMHSLLGYYEVATNCIQEKFPNELNAFRKRFQRWLHEAITPHLSDDHLYAGFDNVINLLDDTRSLCHEVINKSKTVLCKSRVIHWYHYLIIIIIALLLVHMVWCFPGLRSCMNKNGGEDTKCAKSNKSDFISACRFFKCAEVELDASMPSFTAGLRVIKQSKIDTIDNYFNKNHSGMIPRKSVQLSSERFKSDVIQMNTPPVRDVPVTRKSGTTVTGCSSNYIRSDLISLREQYMKSCLESNTGIFGRKPSFDTTYSINEASLPCSDDLVQVTDPEPPPDIPKKLDKNIEKHAKYGFLEFAPRHKHEHREKRHGLQIPRRDKKRKAHQNKDHTVLNVCSHTPRVKISVDEPHGEIIVDIAENTLNKRYKCHEVTNIEFFDENVDLKFTPGTEMLSTVGLHSKDDSVLEIKSNKELAKLSRSF